MRLSKNGTNRWPIPIPKGLRQVVVKQPCSFRLKLEIQQSPGRTGIDCVGRVYNNNVVDHRPRQLRNIKKI